MTEGDFGTCDVFPEPLAVLDEGEGGVVAMWLMGRGTERQKARWEGMVVLIGYKARRGAQQVERLQDSAWPAWKCLQGDTVSRRDEICAWLQGSFPPDQAVLGH